MNHKRKHPRWHSSCPMCKAEKHDQIPKIRDIRKVDEPIVHKRILKKLWAENDARLDD